MYFDKEEFSREMYLQFPDNEDRIITAGLKFVAMGITAFVMLFICWRIGKKQSDKCISFQEAQEKLKDLYHENIDLTPIATIEIEN